MSNPPGADRFPHLLAPVELRGRTLRNRIVFGPHTANFGDGGTPGHEGGGPGAPHVAYSWRDNNAPVPPPTVQIHLRYAAAR